MDVDTPNGEEDIEPMVVPHNQDGGILIFVTAVNMLIQYSYLFWRLSEVLGALQLLQKICNCGNGASPTAGTVWYPRSSSSIKIRSCVSSFQF
jgi:hypothetical protein